MTAPLHERRSFSVLRWRLYHQIRLISKRLGKLECQESQYQQRRNMWDVNCCFFNEQISAYNKGKKTILVTSNFNIFRWRGGRNAFNPPFRAKPLSGGPFAYAPEHPAYTTYKIKLGHARV